MTPFLAIVLTAGAAAANPAATSPAHDDAAIARAASDELLRAYRKEYAFLQAQKRSLEKRLATADGEWSRRIESAQAEIDRLQAELIRQTLAADRDEVALRDAERTTAEVQDSVDRLHAMLTQARTTLAGGGIELPGPTEEEVPLEDIEHAFKEGVGLIRERAEVRQEPGSYFLPDGRQVDGTLMHVGGVATFGISETASGALAPAGEGRLRLWPASSPETANALASAAAPPTLEIFLYEGLDAAVEEKEGKSAIQFIAAGGIIAWVIVALGLLALVMIVLRTTSLLRTASRADELVEEVKPLVASGERKRALELCKPSRGAVARVLAATIRNLDRDREHMEDIVSEAVLHEAPQIERFSAATTVCAAVAPLLGLLGTVTGMIATFEVITSHGTGDPKLLSGGISEALVTTELGLIVAIPTLLLGTLLSARGQVILQRMERAALEIMNTAEMQLEPGVSDAAEMNDESPADGIPERTRERPAA